MTKLYEKYLGEKANFDDEYKEEFADTLNSFIYEFGKTPYYDSDANKIITTFNKMFGKEYPEMKDLVLKLKMHNKLHNNILDIAKKLYKKV